MKCSPFSRRFMMRNRARHFLKRHLRGDHHFSMSQGMEHDHHQRHKLGHGHFRHHKMDHGHGKHNKMGHHHMRMHHENHHGMHPEMFHFKRRNPECMREDSDDTNELPPEVNKDGSTTYAPKSKSQITKENNKFQICLDTSHYQPSEVSVKVVGNKIDVSAVHESTGEGWFEFHEMYRSFDVPDDVKPDTVTSHLDSDGKLTIEATINAEENDTADVREIPVIRVNE